MKTNLLFITILLFTFTAKAQLTEDFNGAVFPPTGWVSFVGENDEGDNGYRNWTRYNNDVAMCRPDDSVTEGLTSEDWLVSHQFIVDATIPYLSFSLFDFDSVDKGSVYSIRVSTDSQTVHGDFSIVQQYLESDLVPFDFTPHYVDLSSYSNQNIYVAFVMEQNDGDYMLVDDVDMVSNIADINNQLLISKVKIFPSIIEDSFTIENQSGKVINTISIFDINGRLVFVKEIRNQSYIQKIRIPNLNFGQYIVKIKFKNSIITKKIIKK